MKSFKRANTVGLVPSNDLRKMFVIASTSDCLKIHQCLSGTQQHYYKSENDSSGGIIKSLSWSRDGRWLMMVPNSGPSEILTVKENLKLLQTIEDIYQPSCAIFQNGTKRNIAIGTTSGEIFLYDIKLRNVKKRFPRAPSSIFQFRWNATDSHIAAACINGNIVLYSNTSLSTSSVYKVPKSASVSAINFHNTKRNLLAGGSEEGIVATWDININKTFNYMKLHQAPVTDLVFSPIRSDLLLSSGLDRKLMFYDIKSKKCVIEVELFNCATAVDCSPCGTYVAAGSHTGNITIYDTRNFKNPFSTYAAHDCKRIRHLYFQKKIYGDCSENLSSICIKEDSVKASNLEYKNLIDSLGLIVFDDSNCSNRDMQKVKTQENSDSFLAALGLDSSVTSHNSLIIEGTAKEVQKSPNVEPTIPLPNTLIPLKCSIKRISSTPKTRTEALPSISESPIGENLNMPESGQLLEEFREIVRDVVKIELQKFKNDLKGELFEDFHCIRRQILDLHMAHVKQSIVVENKFTKIEKQIKFIANKE